MAKVSIKFLIISIILVLVNVILNIVFSFKYAKYKLDENGIFLEIMNSLKGKLIYSFELKPYCSSEEEILSLGKWDGLNEGCNCKGKIQSKVCTEYDINNKCQKIQSLRPIEYKKINSNYICIRKSNSTYIDLMKAKQILPKDSICPDNLKLCGIIDTLENIFCVPKNEICPITLEDIINSNANISNNNYDYYRNATINSKILSIFKLAEDSGPCIDPSEKKWKNNHILEENKKCTTKIFGKLYDDRYERINIINTTRKELYQNNSIINFYDKETIMNETIYLYARYFIGFKYETIYKYYYSYKELISNQKVPNKCNSVMKIFSFILLSIIISPFICMTKNNCRVDEICTIFFVTIIIIAIILSFFTDVILCIIIFIYSSKIKSDLDIQENDKYSNELIQNLIDHHLINRIFSLINFIIFFIAISIGILYFIYIKWKKYQKKNKNEKNINNYTNKVADNKTNPETQENKLDQMEKLTSINNANEEFNYTQNLENIIGTQVKIDIDNNLHQNINSNNQLNYDLQSYDNIRIKGDNNKKSNLSKSVQVGNDEEKNNNKIEDTKINKSTIK